MLRKADRKAGNFISSSSLKKYFRMMLSIFIKFDYILQCINQGYVVYAIG